MHYAGEERWGQLQGLPHFLRIAKQGTGVGSRRISLGPGSWDIIRIISENFIIQSESSCLAEHQSPIQGLEASVLEIMTSLRPLTFFALGFGSLAHALVCTYTHTGTHASFLGFRSAKEFVGTFQGWKADKLGEAGGPGNARLLLLTAENNQTQRFPRACYTSQVPHPERERPGAQT